VQDRVERLRMRGEPMPRRLQFMFCGDIGSASIEEMQLKFCLSSE
jgi:hypothetical protein